MTLGGAMAWCASCCGRYGGCSDLLVAAINCFDRCVVCNSTKQGPPSGGCQICWTENPRSYGSVGGIVNCFLALPWKQWIHRRVQRASRVARIRWRKSFWRRDAALAGLCLRARIQCSSEMRRCVEVRARRRQLPTCAPRGQQSALLIPLRHRAI